MRINEIQMKSLKNEYKTMKINEFSMTTIENLLEINENQWKSLKTDESTMKSNKNGHPGGFSNFPSSRVESTFLQGKLTFLQGKFILDWGNSH